MLGGKSKKFIDDDTEIILLEKAYRGYRKILNKLKHQIEEFAKHQTTIASMFKSKDSFKKGEIKNKNQTEVSSNKLEPLEYIESLKICNTLHNHLVILSKLKTKLDDNVKILVIAKIDEIKKTEKAKVMKSMKKMNQLKSEHASLKNKKDKIEETEAAKGRIDLERPILKQQLIDTVRTWEKFHVSVLTQFTLLFSEYHQASLNEFHVTKDSLACQFSLLSDKEPMFSAEVQRVELPQESKLIQEEKPCNEEKPLNENKLVQEDKLQQSDTQIQGTSQIKGITQIERTTHTQENILLEGNTQPQGDILIKENKLQQEDKLPQGNPPLQGDTLLQQYNLKPEENVIQKDTPKEIVQPLRPITQPIFEKSLVNYSAQDLIEAIVIHDFAGIKSDELNVKSGERIMVLDGSFEEWFIGIHGKECGLVPKSYVIRC